MFPYRVYRERSYKIIPIAKAVAACLLIRAERRLYENSTLERLLPTLLTFFRHFLMEL